MTTGDTDAQRLIDRIGGREFVVVAFSGGVDSTVVAAAAKRADVPGAVAVTADSPSVARWQLETASRLADEIGIEHHVVKTDEGDRPEYRRNDDRRCFYCKETLYRSLAAVSQRFPRARLLSGTNADDLGDYRPGIEAGTLAEVETPLADLAIGKEGVRSVAREFGLSNSELAASPCLASRIAYGTEVTPERLGRVERAEQWLQERGFTPLRVRLHAGELARIEVVRGQLNRLIELDQTGELTDAMRGFGFNFVTVDLQGFDSGSMNRVVVPLLTKADLTQTKGTLH